MENNCSTFTVQELVEQGALAKPLDGNHGGIHPKSSDFVESGIPFVMASDLKEGRVDTTDCKYISIEQAKTLRKGFAIEGDILLSHKATIGRTAIVGKLETEYIMLTPQVTYYRVLDTSRINPKYLKYYFDSIEFQNLFEQWAGGGSTRLYLGITAQLKLPIKLPDITVQNNIVDIVDSYDLKATLNRKMNQTLEKMAHSIFKSWFVDFDPVIDNALAAGALVTDFPSCLQVKAKLRKTVVNSDNYHPLPSGISELFPSEFVETELGWIPKGWQVSNIGEACSHIIDHRGKTPKKLGGNWSEQGYSAISAKNIKRNQIVRPDTIRYVDEALYQKWMKVPLQPKDILMTSEAPMGEMFFLADKADYLLSQRLYGMRADENKITGEYLNYWLQTDTARADLEGRATGTTVTGIRQVELKKVVVLLPDLDTSKKFSELASQYLLQKEYNNTQISSLEEIRDYVLPNLISGKVQLGKAS